MQVIRRILSKKVPLKAMGSDISKSAKDLIAQLMVKVSTQNQSSRHHNPNSMNRLGNWRASSRTITNTSAG